MQNLKYIYIYNWLKKLFELLNEHISKQIIVKQGKIKFI